MATRTRMNVYFDPELLQQVEMLALRRHIEMKGALKAVTQLTDKDRQLVTDLRAAMDEAVRSSKLMLEPAGLAAVSAASTQ